MTGTQSPDLRQQALAAIKRRSLLCFVIPGLIFAYLVYVFFAFEVRDALEDVKLDNAAILVGDSYSYKTEVSLNNRSGDYIVAIEGEKKGRYTPSAHPAWVAIDGENADVDLTDGYRVIIRDREVTFTIPGYGQIVALPTRRGVEVDLPDGPLPSWINLSKTRLNVKTPNGRISVTKAKTTIFRYFFGWELFWFTLDSPYNGLGITELVSLALSNERNENGQTHALAIFLDFWFNPMWRHGEVAWMISGFCISARAMATRCCCPPDKASARFVQFSATPRRSRISMARLISDRGNRFRREANVDRVFNVPNRTFETTSIRGTRLNC